MDNREEACIKLKRIKKHYDPGKEFLVEDLSEAVRDYTAALKDFEAAGIGTHKLRLPFEDRRRGRDLIRGVARENFVRKLDEALNLCKDIPE